MGWLESDRAWSESQNPSFVGSTAGFPASLHSPYFTPHNLMPQPLRAPEGELKHPGDEEARCSVLFIPPPQVPQRRMRLAVAVGVPQRGATGIGKPGRYAGTTGIRNGP